MNKVNNKIKIIDSIKTLNEKLHTNGINEMLRGQFVGTCLLALKNGLIYKNTNKIVDSDSEVELSEKIVIKNIKNILLELLTKNDNLNNTSKLLELNNNLLDDNDISKLTI